MDNQPSKIAWLHDKNNIPVFAIIIFLLVVLFLSAQWSSASHPNADAAVKPTEKNIYIIDAVKWGIYTDGTHSLETSIGINNALQYAYQNKYNGVYLSKGIYLIDAVKHSVLIPDKLSFYMHPDCILQVEPTYRPLYSVIKLKDCTDIEIKGGQIIGDRENHIYSLPGLFEKGSIDENGLPIDDGAKIRSVDFIDSSTYAVNFLGEKYQVDKNASIVPATADIYQYDANGKFISKVTGVALNSQTVTRLANAVKFKVVIAQADPAGAQVYFKNGVYPTHEFGYGIQLLQCTNVKITDCYIGKCTGDSIIFDHNNIYKQPSTNVIVDNCILDNSRRQGISVVCGSSLIFKNNTIKNINGTNPQYGIDIEDETGHGNDILIENNIFSGNAKGDVDNYNGKNVIIRKNTMQGGISGKAAFAIATVYGYNSIYEDNVITGIGTGVTAILCSAGGGDYSSKWFIVRGNKIKGATTAISVNSTNTVNIENNYIENCVNSLDLNTINNLVVNGNTHYNNTSVNYDWLNKVLNGSIVGENIYNSVVKLPQKVPMVSSSLCSCLLAPSGNGEESTFLSCVFNALEDTQTKQLVAYDGNFKFQNCTFKGTVSNVAGKNGYYINAGGKITFIGCTIDTNACRFLQTYTDALIQDCNIKVNATVPVTMLYSVAFNPAIFVIQNCNFRNIGASAITINLGAVVSTSYFINNVKQGAITVVKNAAHTEVNTVTITQ